LNEAGVPGAPIYSIDQMFDDAEVISRSNTRDPPYRETPRRDILTVSDPHGSSLEERN